MSFFHRRPWLTECRSLLFSSLSLHTFSVQCLLPLKRRKKILVNQDTAGGGVSLGSLHNSSNHSLGNQIKDSRLCLLLGSGVLCLHSMNDKEALKIILRRDQKQQRHRKELLHEIKTHGWDATVKKIQQCVDFLTEDEISDALREYLKQ